MAAAEGLGHTTTEQDETLATTEEPVAVEVQEEGDQGDQEKHRDGDDEDDDDGNVREEEGEDGAPLPEPQHLEEELGRMELSPPEEEEEEAVRADPEPEAEEAAGPRASEPSPEPEARHIPEPEIEEPVQHVEEVSAPASRRSSASPAPRPAATVTADDYAYVPKAKPSVRAKPTARDRGEAAKPRVKVLSRSERSAAREGDAPSSRAGDPDLARPDAAPAAAPGPSSSAASSRHHHHHHSVPEGRPPPVESSRMQGLVAELGSKLARQTAKLEAAEKGKEELEDMLLRIEKHFKTEQMLRRKAEVSLDQMRASLKNSEMDGSRIKQERQALERQKLKNIQERTKLEEERSQMQVVVQAAGEQERKAKLELQELHHSVTTREEMITYRLQATYSATIAKLEAEISRLQEELEFRTVSMHQELQKWRDQAQFATNALREAKNEVIDRKRELDTTKERMDLLVEKLYTGRERGMELRGAIDVQIHQSQLAHEMREKFQQHQGEQRGALVPVEMPPPAFVPPQHHNPPPQQQAHHYHHPAPVQYSTAAPQQQEASLRLPSVQAPAPKASQPGRAPQAEGTPRGVPRAAKRGAAGPSSTRATAAKAPESRRQPAAKKGYAQIHHREAAGSAKRSRPAGGTPPTRGGRRHRPPTSGLRGGGRTGGRKATGRAPWQPMLRGGSEGM